MAAPRVLPLAWPALCRADGQVWLGLQVHAAAPATPAATWPTRCCGRSRPSPGTPVAAGRPARRRARGCRTCSSLDEPLEPSRCTRASTSGSPTATSAELDPEVAGVAGAGQLRRRTDRAAQLGRRGVLVPDRRAHPPALGRCRTTRSRCSTRWPGCTRPGGAGSATPAGTSGRSGRTACWCRCGTWPVDAEAADVEAAGGGVRRPARARRWPRTEPLTAGRAAGPGRRGQPPGHPALSRLASARGLRRARAALEVRAGRGRSGRTCSAARRGRSRARCR